jgi:hypothetical protein
MSITIVCDVRPCYDVIAQDVAVTRGETFNNTPIAGLGRQIKAFNVCCCWQDHRTSVVEGSIVQVAIANREA